MKEGNYLKKSLFKKTSNFSSKQEVFNRFKSNLFLIILPTETLTNESSFINDTLKDEKVISNKICNEYF